MTPTRTHVVRTCRVRHVLGALAHLYLPDEHDLATWSGTTREGDWLQHHTSGDHWIVAWTPDRIVGLVFDHESERSRWHVREPDRDPLEHLQGIDDPWATLAREAAASVEDLVTAGFWGDEGGLRWSDDGSAHGLQHFHGFTLPLDDAVPRWCEQLGLTEAHGDLAQRLAGNRGTLTDDDQDILLEAPRGVRRLDVEAVRAAAAQLAEAGIRWNVPIRRIRELNAAFDATERARVAAAVPAEARALFEAVRAGDAARVRLLALPSTVDARTVEEQWAATPAGDTPLIQAFKSGAPDCAIVLLRAGASVDLANDHGQTGLLWAARFGEPEVLRACILASRDPGRADQSGHTPLHHAAAGGHGELCALLLDRGADPRVKDRLRTTPADWAQRSGHAALADRLRQA